uniref:Uncharacterized protein n=1 Tax=Arion vulgaris TaxID=1028688 RepID=A0A0B6YVH7_9EUPU
MNAGTRNTAVVVHVHHKHTDVFYPALAAYNTGIKHGCSFLDIGSLEQLGMSLHQGH